MEQLRTTSEPARDPLRRWADLHVGARAALTIAAYLLAAVAARLLDRPDTDLINFWPPVAAGALALLLSPRRDWPALVPAITVASIAFDALDGVEPLTVLGLALANTLEALSIAIVIGAFAGPRPFTGRLRDFEAIVAGAAAGPAVGASIGSVVAVLGFDAELGEAWLSWWLGSSLGLLVVVPIVCGVPPDGGPLFPRRRAELALTLLVAVLLIEIALGATGAPLGWLMALPVLWAGLRLGPLGTALVASASGIAVLQVTVNGAGVFALTVDDWRDGVLLAQAYLLSVVLLGGTLAAASEERAATAARLRLSEERFRVLVEHVPGVFWLAEHPSARLLYVSQDFEATWGVPLAELYESPRQWLDRIHPDDRARIRAVARRRHESGFDEEYRVIRPDGSVAWVHDRAFPITDDDGAVRAIAGLATDVTAAKQMEMQLLHAQKMEGIGRLAGGIAHDFNNLLTIIGGYGRLALDAIARGDDPATEVRQMVAAGEKAGALTSQLLAFSHRKAQDQRPVDVNQAVSDMDRMLRRVIGEQVELVCRLDDAAGSVTADAGQLEQILLNLAVNACDAMPQGGRLAIETAAARLDEQTAARTALTPGEYAVIHVSDDGIGMDEGTRARAFDPFFTTKPLGQGTGLGLSTVYGIVEQWGGHVTLDSALMRGTTVSMYLPRADGAADTEPAPAAPPVRQAGGGETLLVVEDDPALRALICITLGDQGYRLLEASDGEVALAVAGRHGAQIDLLVSDIVMPNLSGPELHQRLLERRPGLPALFMSGYPERTAADAEALVAGNFIGKPFSPPELARRVRALLDAG